MKKEGNVFYPKKFWPSKETPKPEEPADLSGEKREEVERFLESFKESFLPFLPPILEKLKAKTEGPGKIFSPGNDIRKPFEAETEFAREYLYFLEFKEEWENKIIQLIGEVRNKKGTESLLKNLKDYLANMQMKSKEGTYLATEGDIIRTLGEFIENWKKNLRI